MSSSNPPYPNFNGITYNSSFFPTESSALTQGQANLLYLRKTVADTATAQETFTTGIATNNLNTTSTASNLVIGSNTNTGTIFINTSATNNTNTDPAIAIGTSSIVKTIKIGSSALTNSVHLANLDITANSLNNIVATSGIINIANNQTTAKLNIGTAGGRSGDINIGDDGSLTAQTSNINIGLNTFGDVSIGANIGGSVNINGPLNSTGQATFDLAPHCVVIPTFSEDLTNKLYVDSRIASGGSNFFYFNYSVDSDLGPTEKKLGNSIVITTLQTVPTTQSGTNSIARFISDVGVPNITTIPSGIWELNQWGNAVGGHTGTLFYFFKLFTYRPSTLTFTLRGTSGNSQVIDLTTPSLYFASLSLGSFAVALEDRIVIDVFSVGVGTGGVNTLNSYYQENYYSYLSCPIIEGTDLLNKANTWTGTNSFTAATTVPTLTFPSNETKAVNSAYLTTNYVPNSTNTPINGTKTFGANIIAPGINANGAGAAFALCNTSTSGTIGIGQAASRTAAIGIGDGNTCSHSQNISNGNSHTGTVNIINGLTSGGTINLASGAGTLQTTNVNIASGTTSGAVTIGNANSSTALNGTTTISSLTSLTTPNPINLSYVTIPTFTSGQIGYTYPITSSVSGTFTSGVAKLYGTQVVTIQGVYLINCTGVSLANCVMTSKQSSITADTTIPTVVNTIAQNVWGMSGNTFSSGNSEAMNLTAVFSVVKDTTFNFYLTYIFTGTSMTASTSGFRMTVTRIA